MTEKNKPSIDRFRACGASHHGGVENISIGMAQIYATASCQSIPRYSRRPSAELRTCAYHTIILYTHDAYELIPR